MSQLHHQAHHDQEVRGLRAALGLTLGFMLIEVIGGWLSGSLTLIADALHMLADSGGLLLALVAGWIGRLPPTPKLSFGYRRAEILAALLSGLSIWLVCGILIIESLDRVANPHSVLGKTVTVIAVIGLVVNLITLRVLDRAKHHHGDGQASLNLRAAHLHVLSDVAGSVIAIVSGVVIHTLGWVWVDPVATLFLSGLVLISGWRLVREAVSILMESAPYGINPITVKNDLQTISGVQEVHDLHIWTVAGQQAALSVHIVAEMTEGILDRATSLLEAGHGIRHTTIQIERPGEFSRDRCYSCK